MTDQPSQPEPPWDERFQPYVERGVHFVPHPDGTYEAVSKAVWDDWFERRDFEESPTGPGTDPRLEKRRVRRAALRAELDPVWGAEQERLHPSAARLDEPTATSTREHWRNIARGLFGLVILVLLARALWQLLT